MGRLANDLRGLCVTLCAAPWRPEQVQDFCRVVSSLYALLTAHWAKEEALYSRLPNSKLTAAAAHGLQVAMQMVQAVASQPQHQLTADSAQ